MFLQIARKGINYNQKKQTFDNELQGGGQLAKAKLGKKLIELGDCR